MSDPEFSNRPPPVKRLWNLIIQLAMVFAPILDAARKTWVWIKEEAVGMKKGWHLFSLLGVLIVGASSYITWKILKANTDSGKDVTNKQIQTTKENKPFLKPEYSSINVGGDNNGNIANVQDSPNAIVNQTNATINYGPIPTIIKKQVSLNFPTNGVFKSKFLITVANTPSIDSRNLIWKLIPQNNVNILDYDKIDQVSAIGYMAGFQSVVSVSFIITTTDEIKKDDVLFQVAAKPSE